MLNLSKFATLVEGSSSQSRISAQPDVGHVAGAVAWNVSGRTVLLCIMKQKESVFMYLPILRTLEVGFQALGANVTYTSGSGPRHRSALLRAGDVLVWVGMGNLMSTVPLASLGTRGVRRVYYHTEPMQQTCNTLNSTNWDEMWHYSLHNANLCWQTSARRVVHRYIPPGGLDAHLFMVGGAWLPVAAGPAVFLGIIPRNSTPSMPGYARRACYGALARELGNKSLIHRQNAFGITQIRRLLRSHGTFVNLHKDCGEANRPAEAVRFSLLLSAGARIVSERADEADERQFAGFVTFAALPQLGSAVTRALAEQATEPNGASEARAAAFRERFAPAAIFARAGLSTHGTTSGTTSAIMSGNSRSEPMTQSIASGGPCAGQPFSYKAGALEKLWDPPVAGHICRTAEAQAVEAGLGVAYAEEAAGEQWRTPTAREGELLSRFVCQDGGTEWIEPLTGMARHPHANLGCRLPVPHVGIYNISHMVLSNRCPARDAGVALSSRNRGSGGGASILYDLGCSWYWKPPLCEYNPGDRRCPKVPFASPPPPPPSPPRPPPAGGKAKRPSGSAVGPSLPLFHALYELNCIRFDRMHAWEATKFNHSLWWRNVPNDVRHRLNFHNQPVTAEGFVQYLADTARPEDFVALKVDIDGGPEIPIVRAIAERPELARLVDEVFFEYHFDFDGIDFGWHIRKPGARRRFRYDTYSNATVDDALGQMRQLRERGVRSHFWV